MDNITEVMERLGEVEKTAEHLLRAVKTAKTQVPSKHVSSWIIGTLRGVSVILEQTANHLEEFNESP